MSIVCSRYCFTVIIICWDFRVAFTALYHVFSCHNKIIKNYIFTQKIWKKKPRSIPWVSWILLKWKRRMWRREEEKSAFGRSKFRNQNLQIYHEKQNKEFKFCLSVWFDDSRKRERRKWNYYYWCCLIYVTQLYKIVKRR